MKQNCFRLLRLINNLIDITKIDSGYFKINLENSDIVKVVEDITLSVANYIENKGVELIFDTNIEEKIMAFDPEKLERILLNLLSNALKFTSKEDRIDVIVLDKGNEVVIEVKDTGIGIPKEQQERIFDRFIQVDKSLTRDHEGSGIGLSLVKSLVEMHEGNITLKSKYGEGSSFIINIPSNLIIEDNDYIYGVYEYNGDEIEYMLYNDSSDIIYKDMIIQGYGYLKESEAYVIHIREFFEYQNGELVSPPTFLHLYFKNLEGDWKITSFEFDV